MCAENRVVIWRSSLLPASEPFIRNQADALTQWQPTFLGAFKVDSVLAADSDIIAFKSGNRGTRAFLSLRITGRSSRLRGVLRELRPTVVHAHFGGDAWLVSRSAVQLGVPLVVTVHGYDLTMLPSRPGIVGVRYRRNLRTVFDRATLILAVSEFMRRRAIELGASPTKVRVHHTGVPIPPAPASDGPKRWDVAFVGPFAERKGIDDLIEAVGMLQDPRPRTVFVGEGPLEPRMREQAAAWGLDATFLGAREPSAVAHCLVESRIYVSPYRTAPNGETEGLSTTILEAASLGLPTVSTYHRGIAEGVVHGATGLLCQEGDREALSKSIRQLLAEESLRLRLGAEARQNVEERFDITKQTRRLEVLYDMVAGTPHAGPTTGRAAPIRPRSGG